MVMVVGARVVVGSTVRSSCASVVGCSCAKVAAGSCAKAAVVNCIVAVGVVCGIAAVSTVAARDSVPAAVAAGFCPITAAGLGICPIIAAGVGFCSVTVAGVRFSPIAVAGAKVWPPMALAPGCGVLKRVSKGRGVRLAPAGADGWMIAVEWCVVGVLKRFCGWWVMGCVSAVTVVAGWVLRGMLAKVKVGVLGVAGGGVRGAVWFVEAPAFAASSCAAKVLHRSWYALSCACCSSSCARRSALISSSLGLGG